MSCYLCHFRAHTIGRLQVWNDPVSLWQHKWLDDVRRGMPSSPFDSTYGQKWHTIISIAQYTQSDHVRRDMRSSPLDNIHMDRQCRAWLVITALENHTLSDEVRSDILSLPLDCTHAHSTLGVVMLESPLGSTRGRKKKGVYSHPIFPFGKNTW